MGQKMSLSKTTANGEQLTFILAQCNEVTGEEMMTSDQFTETSDAIITYSDIRMQEMNLRHLEAYQLDRFFTPPMWYRVRAILGAIGGQQTIQALAGRWEAEEEETRSAEQGRAEALAKKHNQEVYEFNAEWYAVGGPRDVPLTLGDKIQQNHEQAWVLASEDTEA